MNCEWFPSSLVPPMSDSEWRGLFVSKPILIKTKRGRFVVGYAEQYEGYDVEWKEGGRDAYHIDDVEKWTHIEE